MFTLEEFGCFFGGIFSCEICSLFAVFKAIVFSSEKLRPIALS